MADRGDQGWLGGGPVRDQGGGEEGLSQQREGADEGRRRGQEQAVSSPSCGRLAPDGGGSLGRVQSAVLLRLGVIRTCPEFLGSGPAKACSRLVGEQLRITENVASV